jgi:hypothetical protein
MQEFEGKQLADRGASWAKRISLAAYPVAFTGPRPVI